MIYNSILIQDYFISSFLKYIELGYNIIDTHTIYEVNELDSIIIRLTNKKINRIMHFRFQVYSGPDKLTIAEFVYFSIEENNKRILFDQYWRQKKGEKNRIVSLISHVNEKTLKKRLNKYFVIVKETIETDFEKVIKGEEWIDVPFDWSGYNK
jgi:hypothetical protein